MTVTVMNLESLLKLLSKVMDKLLVDGAATVNRLSRKLISSLTMLISRMVINLSPVLTLTLMALNLRRMLNLNRATLVVGRKVERLKSRHGAKLIGHYRLT